MIEDVYSLPCVSKRQASISSLAITKSRLHLSKAGEVNINKAEGFLRAHKIAVRGQNLNSDLKYRGLRWETTPSTIKLRLRGTDRARKVREENNE